MEASPTGNPASLEFEQSVELNCEERSQLLAREWGLRKELREIIRSGAPMDRLEEVRGRDRECRAELARNLDQYDVLIEQWAGAAALPEEEPGT